MNRAHRAAEFVAERFGVPVDYLDRPLNHLSLGLRHLAYALARSDGLSYPQIADYWGRDHTTIMAAIKHGARHECPELVKRLIAEYRGTRAFARKGENDGDDSHRNL